MKKRDYKKCTAWRAKAGCAEMCYDFCTEIQRNHGIKCQKEDTETSNKSKFGIIIVPGTGEIQNFKSTEQMEISQHIFKDYVVNLKQQLEKLLQYKTLGNAEKGWIKYPNTLQELVPNSQKGKNLASNLDDTAVYKKWEYGILHYDSVSHIFLNNILIMRHEDEYRIYSINIGVTPESLQEQGYYISNSRYPTLKQVQQDFKHGRFKLYNSLIGKNDALLPFNTSTDRVSDFNWIYSIVSFWLEEVKNKI